MLYYFKLLQDPSVEEVKRVYIFEIIGTRLFVGYYSPCEFFKLFYKEKKYGK